MLILIFLIISTAFAHQCPQSVKDELELISLPLDCFRSLYDSSHFDGNRMARIVGERIQNFKRLLQEITM